MIILYALHLENPPVIAGALDIYPNTRHAQSFISKTDIERSKGLQYQKDL
jgi:hypothetical protein